MNTKLIRSTDVIWEELDGRVLLVHAKTGARWTLNTAALQVWKLCDGTRTAESLAKALAATTRRSLTDCWNELERFAQLLSGMGLLYGYGTIETLPSVLTAQLSPTATLRANFQGKYLGGVRHRPSPRGNSGPG